MRRFVQPLPDDRYSQDAAQDQVDADALRLRERNDDEGSHTQTRADRQISSDKTFHQPEPT